MPEDDLQHYYEDPTYWNGIPLVAAHLDRRISGNPDVDWMDHFAATSGRVFERALVLNCGNGWVERAMLDKGIAKRAVGTDISEQLLDEARKQCEGRPIEYVQLDVNTGALPGEGIDLVVNVAAAHHIRCIDKVFRQLAEILPPDGCFVSYDYVGPHRNQWPLQMWSAAWEVNESLPADLRQDMLGYPHLPTMLVTDPSEAIHSELILETFDRYFTRTEFKAMGGAIAYPLLTHNPRAYTEDQDRWLDEFQRIIDADVRHLDEHPEDVLFAYFTGTPKKDVLAERAQLAEWSRIEEEREAAAERNGGEYYPRTMLQTLYLALAGTGVTSQPAMDNASERQTTAEAQLRELKESRSWRVTVPLRATSDLVRKIRR